MVDCHQKTFNQRPGLPSLRKTEPYAQDEPVKPEQEILQDFLMKSVPRLILAEKLFDLASEKEDLQADLPQVLHEATVA